ncbi:hypothetical protein [Streptomyces sp. CRN 30]|uniref:hypothetical protein n=1 Tax=Streptomyces sp. CRN 30 TaxID=3075613 RepID=UPI002A82EC9C|nr:hypothetical protein [Streptomyces sp. CRN 30]
MLALRLIRVAHPAVQLRRLLVVAASAGTGFLLLCCLGHAMTHPDTVGGSALRLSWCLAPLAATVYLAMAVARTDPGTRPRGGLSAIGLGPGRLMAVSAATTAAACALGSLLALLLFLRLRGDLAGAPFEGAVTGSLAVGLPLPLPAVVTLLVLVPAAATTAVAMALRPRETPRPAPTPGAGRRYGRFGAYGLATRETFGTYGRFGAHRAAQPPSGAPTAQHPDTAKRTLHTATAGLPLTTAGIPLATAGTPTATEPVPPTGATAPPSVPGTTHGDVTPPSAPDSTPPSAPDSTSPSAPDTVSPSAPDTISPSAPDDAPPAVPGTGPASTAGSAPGAGPVATPRTGTTALPWGVAVLAAGLAVEAMAGPGDGDTPAAGVLVGWALTALGLALAGPGLTLLCGRLLQGARPGALRLLAGRLLMAEAHRIGRPLGVVCAVASAAYAAATLHGAGGTTFGPLSTVGAVLVAGCAVATLLTTAVEARQDRADTTAALLRLGAPATALRGAAALRAAALLALFGPLTLVVAQLAALPLTRT